MKLRPPAHGTVVAYVALFFAMSGTAVAATGSTFLSGKANTASTVTSLSNSGGTALSLGGGRGAAPLAVNNSTKVARLNADLVDGVDSSALQRRVTGTCPEGQAVRAISATGGVVCTPTGGVDAAPQPARYRDKGFAISDLQVGQDSLGDWDGRARLTNEGSATRSAGFTVTVFRDGTVIATLKGSVSALAPGSTNTVDLVSSDDWSDGAHTTTFQVDYAFNG